MGALATITPGLRRGPSPTGLIRHCTVLRSGYQSTPKHLPACVCTPCQILCTGAPEYVMPVQLNRSTASLLNRIGGKTVETTPRSRAPSKKEPVRIRVPARTQPATVDLIEDDVDRSPESSDDEIVNSPRGTWRLDARREGRASGDDDIQYGTHSGASSQVRESVGINGRKNAGSVRGQEANRKRKREAAVAEPEDDAILFSSQRSSQKSQRGYGRGNRTTTNVHTAPDSSDSRHMARPVLGPGKRRTRLVHSQRD